MPLEIACFTLESALRAASCGANRIELCSRPAMGGATPEMDDFTQLLSTIKSSRRDELNAFETRNRASSGGSLTRSDNASPRHLQPVTTTDDCKYTYQNIPIYVMLRPARNAKFDYSASEIVALAAECGRFNDAGASGFVFGILTSTQPPRINVAACQRLVDLATASRKPCTFHRAFDELPPETMLQQLEVLIALGFKAVLTSGGGGSAVEGKAMLRRLVEAAGARIDVVVGGGVRSGNLAELRGAVYGDGETRGWWHSSAILRGCQEADRGEIMDLAKLVKSSRREGAVDVSDISEAPFVD